MSDSEIDDLQHFEASRERELRKRAGLNDNVHQDEELSDEEVMGLHSDSDSDMDTYYNQTDADVQKKRERTNREIDSNWGATRDNYFGGEDDIGQDEGASDEEEEEALRLQQQELAEMDENDFVDQVDLQSWKNNGNDDEIIDDAAKNDTFAVDLREMSADERLEYLQSQFPAVILLANELKKFDEWESMLNSDSDRPPNLVEAGKSALQTYKGVIYAFFALFNDRLRDLKALKQLNEHPVNEALLLSRQLWLNYLGTSQELADGAGLAEPAAENASEFNDNNLASVGNVSDENSAASDSDMAGLDSDTQDSDTHITDDSGNDDFDNNDLNNDDSEKDEFSIKKPSKTAIRPVKVAGDYDETADTIEQQARAKNKQSLRFYTSQIGKNNRERVSMGGDEDLPYKERDFERRARLMAEAKQRGQEQRDRLGGGDGDQETDGYSNDGEGYMDDEALDLYQQTQRERLGKKQAKEDRHTAALHASRAGKLVDALRSDPNGDKRAINYQIQKNKGLMKHRKKENRNARVKKRVRYEAAQKKLKGVRKVYTGQQGPYQGEMSGIRKNLSHSAKFKS